MKNKKSYRSISESVTFSAKSRPCRVKCRNFSKLGFSFENLTWELALLQWGCGCLVIEVYQNRISRLNLKPNLRTGRVVFEKSQQVSKNGKKIKNLNVSPIILFSILMIWEFSFRKHYIVSKDKNQLLTFPTAITFCNKNVRIATCSGELPI